MGPHYTPDEAKALVRKVENAVAAALDPIIEQQHRDRCRHCLAMMLTAGILREFAIHAAATIGLAPAGEQAAEYDGFLQKVRDAVMAELRILQDHTQTVETPAVH